MIHVGTAEDVLGALADGWQLRGLTTPLKRGLTYWLLPQDTSPYAAKRVNAALVTKLEVAGKIHGARDEYGEMRYRLVAGAPAEQQERLLDVGA